MAKFDDLLNELKDGLLQIARTEAVGFVEQAKSDGQAFLTALEADLKTWTEQLAAGQLSPNDFKFLVQGKADLARMNALTQAGLASVRIDRIRSAMIDLIITVAGKAASF
jgi:hypothetical protein